MLTKDHVSTKIWRSMKCFQHFNMHRHIHRSLDSSLIMLTSESSDSHNRPTWRRSNKSILEGTIITIAEAELSFFGGLVYSFNSFSRGISEAMVWQKAPLSSKICFARWISNQQQNVCQPLTVGVSCLIPKASTVNFKSEKKRSRKGAREREVCLLSSEGQIRAHFSLRNRNKRPLRVLWQENDTISIP